MSGFLFNRQPSSVKRHNGTPSDQQLREQGTAETLQGVLQAQSITASAIFAMLVSKNILSAREAAEYMSEIRQVLERDVKDPIGAVAGKMLGTYSQALVAADE